MPLPARKPGEGRDEFVSRCMRDPTMRREFPRARQRLAVCERQADKNKTGKEGGR